jgi:predicted nucleic acid-binding Zn ribbon protein
MAAHVVPESFDPGTATLVLRADSSAWATQVNFLLGTLRQRLAAEVGSATVTTVRVVGPTAPSWRFGNRHVSGRGPRDTYG